MDGILIALAAVAAILALVASVRAARARAWALRYQTALDDLERELGPISERIRGAVERSRPTDEPTPETSDPKIEELLERIAEDGSAVVALRRLADEVAPGSTTRRRAGYRGNRSGYQAELDREVARARRTGQPLSLVLIDVAEPTPDRLLQLAALLTRFPRVTDTVCRRGRDAFGILLPETAEEGARRFHERLHEEVARTFAASRRTTFATGIVEWRPTESGEALDARARAAIRARTAGSNGVAADTPA